MSCYVILSESGKVTGRRSAPYEGHVEAPDWVECDDVCESGIWIMDENRRVQAINDKSRQIIIDKFPSWKQHNMERRLRQLKDKLLILPLSEDAAERDALEADFAWIDSVVAESDRLTADPNATPNWPE